MRNRRPGFLAGVRIIRPRHGLGQTADELQAQIAKLEKEVGTIQTTPPPVMSAPTTSYMAPTPQFSVLPQEPKEPTTQEKVDEIIAEYREKREENGPSSVIPKVKRSNGKQRPIIQKPGLVSWLTGLLFGN